MKNSLSNSISKFFSIYLSKQRNVSKNTILSYRDTFKLFFRFLKLKNVDIDRLTIEHLNKALIEEFLVWLSEERSCSPATINNRLNALCCYVNYIKYDDPLNLMALNQILNIPLKKGQTKNIDHLSVDQIKLLFSVFDTSSKHEFRDYVLIRLMYETGARVQEVVDLKIRDFTDCNKPLIRIFGKGRKYRTLPLDVDLAELLRKYITGYVNNSDSQHLFQGPQRASITRQGIQYILNKYCLRAHAIDNNFPKHIHCHMLRHSKAFHMLANDIPLIIIRDFLGHSSVETTQVYARSDTSLKEKALSKTRGIVDNPDMQDWEDCPDIMNFLESLNVK